jgi:hypothetical protein
MQAAVQHRGRVDASEEQERWSGLWLSAFWRLVEWWLSLCVTAWGETMKEKLGFLGDWIKDIGLGRPIYGGLKKWKLKISDIRQYRG